MSKHKLLQIYKKKKHMNKIYNKFTVSMNNLSHSVSAQYTHKECSGIRLKLTELANDLDRQFRQFSVLIKSAAIFSKENDFTCILLLK